MRLSRWLLGLAVVLLWAAPAHGAEELKMNCPVCDHVDVDGSGLEPNKTLTLSILDVRSGQKVIPDTQVTTSASGSFSRELDVDLVAHPSLLGNLYEPSGSAMILAIHSRAQAPAHCARAASLPYTGARPGVSAVAGGVLLAVGGALLLATRRRPGSAGT